ncbi:Inositol 2-dehydrogenase/D-chiro-inositol 3-dehydrogenase [Pirellula sp. SH-Sr6A]|uniref:Gfo/Idh/MocA family protein n=1 Tax=Pirellula sp. SH-Sr6A TaxID=1632865 RepID=UPI00078D5DAE|nr:Gfo/Idh/MocA family oxidoreductase [Pirellula sp. SH-Sr6A]AMV34510.1 Inositol 2-dehydrogenase/D-chiro-inositol 3-dehydrogenase [Pirellula sp. SH-Sr6A]
MKTSTAVAATTSVAASSFARSVHAGEDNTIRVALIGCGGRGSGAAANALSVDNGPIELVAMADVFDYKLKQCYESLNKQFQDKVKVPDDQKFIDFEGYKKAIDCLRPGDIAIMATPPAFRWVQFEYAISKGVNVFMEKPVTVDGPSSVKMLELAKKSIEKNLKVGIGLMCRHCDARRELYRRIQDGQIGDILMMRAYRMAGPTGSAATTKKPEGMSELLYQINRFHGFLWASGGAYSDFLIHNIDECCWMKDAWPVKAAASGGRHYRNDDVDQNFDTYSVEYTFADGTKLLLNGRTIPGCKNEFASYAHGTKGSAVISTAAHTPAKCRIYSGQNIGKRSELVWEFPQPEKSPYQLEWDHLVAAIRDNEPYNEVERGVQASVVTSMGRMAAHTGQEITYDDMLNCKHEFAPGIEKLTFDSPAPLQPLANGLYPVPQPGIVTDQEYQS